MSRRRPRRQPAIARRWQRLSPVARLCWGLVGLAAATALAALDWPPRSLGGVLFPAQLFVASALGAARAWQERRAGPAGPRWRTEWLYLGLLQMIIGATVPVVDSGFRGWWLVGFGLLFAHGCYYVLLGLYGPGTGSAVPAGQRASTG